MYFNGQSFKYQPFAKYAAQVEAESIAQKIKEANLEHDGENVYAKLDFPVNARVLRSVMYTSKNVLILEAGTGQLCGLIPVPIHCGVEPTWFSRLRFLRAVCQCVSKMGGA
eukprot:1708551-Pyramimonas_sp.AAC.1